MARVSVIAAAAAAVALMATAPLAFAEAGKTYYAAASAPLYASASAGKPEAKLTPGTAVQAIGPAAKSLLPVVLEGWQQQGNPTDIFLAVGQRIVLAELASGAPAPKVLATRKDPYDNVWNQVKVTGFVQEGEVVADQQTVWAAAQKLYNARCSACHALHNPNEYTANQWPKVLNTMAKNAALQPAEAALVTQYLQTHAKK